MWMRSSTLLIRINSSRGEESSELKNSVIVTQFRRHRQYEFDKEAH